MNVLPGVIFHFIGGFVSGSFYMPYKKVKGWHWESFWLIGRLFSWSFILTEVPSICYNIHPTAGKASFTNTLNSYFIFKNYHI